MGFIQGQPQQGPLLWFNGWVELTWSDCRPAKPILYRWNMPPSGNPKNLWFSMGSKTAVHHFFTFGFTNIKEAVGCFKVKGRIYKFIRTHHPLNTYLCHRYLDVWFHITSLFQWALHLCTVAGCWRRRLFFIASKSWSLLDQPRCDTTWELEGGWVVNNMRFPTWKYRFGKGSDLISLKFFLGTCFS